MDICYTRDSRHVPKLNDIVAIYADEIDDARNIAVDNEVLRTGIELIAARPTGDSPDIHIRAGITAQVTVDQNVISITGARAKSVSSNENVVSSAAVHAYGGSIENRARLLIEVTEAVAKEIGAERTGVRLSPVSPAGGSVLSGNEQAQYGYVVEKLDGLDIAYIHVVEGATAGPRDAVPFDFGALRKAFRNTYLANNGYGVDLANAHLAEGKADLIAFGRPYIANPDLVERLKGGVPLAQLNPAKLYGGGAEGYIDYPPATVPAAG